MADIREPATGSSSLAPHHSQLVHDGCHSPPFAQFAPPIHPQSPLRQAITAAYRLPETRCLPPLVAAATLPADVTEEAKKTAYNLIVALRAKHRGTGVEGLVQEYALSSQEGVALMCLAEALLRIPDNATRDALIRDKIAGGNWTSHLGAGRSLFVNAATWGLIVTGKLTATVSDRKLTAVLTRLIGRCGEPVIRRAVDIAMRMMGEQFVSGQTIEEALSRARPLRKKGFQHSYDMLGEAATTAADAARYYSDYENAIHAIGQEAGGCGIVEGPGISIKLSALHPRYARAQAERVMAELLPKVKALALLARHYDIGLNIDAEEADRLELSLDLLEELCLDSDLAGWNGLGFVVQAYGKRCPFVLDYVIDLAKRSHRRIMVRLVKGAYWDAEIKRAQLDGLEDFPVFTRKIYTDVSYIACARKLLGATDVIFPQFATHNAQTLATIFHMAEFITGKPFIPGQYEFQCLHGMGEPLYDEVVGADKLNRPCRIYAPVGTHETLLAYLVRRLLENGANSSFVHRIADPAVFVDELIEDPVSVVGSMSDVGAKHDLIALPRELFGAVRTNSSGLDLSNEATLAMLSEALRESAARQWTAEPLLAEETAHENKGLPVSNPGDRRDIVGSVIEASDAQVLQAVKHASAFAPEWASVSVDERAAMLERAADRMEARMPILLGLIMREAGKSIANAIAEVREAVDFLRYYAVEARARFTTETLPLGPVVCISPWNFPLAIFIGEVAAALVAGNPVLAKPAEETPLIAHEGVRILHEAGVPRGALQLLPGDGRVGAALVKAEGVSGVMFTGSTEVARLIQAQLAERLSEAGRPIPLIAETGGQNAMIVDSSALAEQVVIDVIASAFDSAGQRCSALRVLCLQEEVADRTLAMLKGALRELSIGRTDRLCVDVGPVITEEAKATIEAHIEKMRAQNKRIEQITLSGETTYGSFVPPTIIEIDTMADLEREVFGPVLHVIRYARKDLEALIDEINASGYGLTFGLHTRLDETIAQVSAHIKAGNIYVNRNIIGAVVGVQPFGGCGLSGTGPKAGGPLYLGRLVQNAPAPVGLKTSLSMPQKMPKPLADFIDWLEGEGERTSAEIARTMAERSLLGLERELPGPVGERNIYALHPRGQLLLMPATIKGLTLQLAATLATGNTAIIDADDRIKGALTDLPTSVLERIKWHGIQDTHDAQPRYSAALVEGNAQRIHALAKVIAALPGPLVPVHMHDTNNSYLDWLLEEVLTSINTTAAGGNASLMSIG